MNDVLIVGLLFLIAMIVLLYGPWQGMVVATTRQKLFEIRDQAFDMAMTGELSFDDPAYIEYRRRLNSMIRLAHRLTWLQAVAMTPAVNSKTIEPLPVEHLSETIQKKINRLERRAASYLVALLWLRSPIFMLLTGSVLLALPIIVLIYMSSSSVKHLIRHSARSVVTRVRDEAISTGA